MNLNDFITDLAKYESPLVFNPWKDSFPEYEVESAPEIRRRQLFLYMKKRLHRARLLLIAEACGYQGGHFSGIAMTSERMLLNEHPRVNAQMILGEKGMRTSRRNSSLLKPVQREKGFNEPTDSIVWSGCLDAGLSPDEFILWNIFPFHPYKKGNLLTNRTPSEKELTAGLSFTEKLLSLTGPLPLLAIGKKSEITLAQAGYTVFPLRHPANGGANEFRKGLQNFIKLHNP